MLDENTTRMRLLNENLEGIRTYMAKKVGGGFGQTNVCINSKGGRGKEMSDSFLITETC